ncbi:MAG: DUF1127 domain-containing protein [Devosia nanyangense]|uniref:DUF1127 domain-containing protein n=1 Tax=Devosia nanyangense TaxID=1228055 RepID=A0A933L2M3_9HYPH|nr:DUF1127 domain-containing protein [Devosia nanyangense]
MFERLRLRYRTWRYYRDTVRRLTCLDPHILADTGIAPEQIHRRALEASERRCE